MVKHLLLLLGMTESATVSEIKKTYARLVNRLSFGTVSVVHDLQPARERLSQSYEHWKRLGLVEFDAQGAVLSESPKLGQVLVAMDRITFADLLTVLEIQRNNPGARFGEILVSHNYIIAEELDYFLHLQRIIELPIDHPERWGQRLLELGLIGDDQLKIALIDHRRSGTTLRAVLISRGWLSAETLDRIF